jgi:FlaA1/EpsC-like NDP-sugar epimerase
MRLLIRPLGLRIIPLIVLDVALVYGSYAAALLLRFDGNVRAESWTEFWQVTPVIAAGYVAANFIFGIYHSAWKYGGMRDLSHLAIVVGSVTIIVFLVNIFASVIPRRDLPISVNLIGGGLIFLTMAATKLWPHLNTMQFRDAARNGTGKRVLIVGAGEAGQLVAREFLQNPHWQYRPVCFVDDDRKMDGIRIHGVPVAGDRHAIPALVRRHAIDEVALAMSQISRESFNELLGLCKKAGVPVNIIPSPADVLSGKVDRGVTVSFNNQGRRAG